MINKIQKWDKEIHFYDKLNGCNLEEYIVRKRLKFGLKSTICVYMMYEVYENLTKQTAKRHLKVWLKSCN